MSSPFQSTHPRGVRLLRGKTTSPKRCFNPRTHAGCDAPRQENGASDSMFQSTHPRGVRPLRVYELLKKFKVSIHAPTRGATGAGGQGLQGQRVSIHAPTRGATYQNAYQTDGEIVSIHAPTRGATKGASPAPDVSDAVSIHAPTRGATIWAACPRKSYLTFQSTHPRGVRLRLSLHSNTARVMFQSTHPRGVRHDQ